MQTHQLKPKTRRKTKKQVGRGGKRGRTSGRGTKGQGARAGHKKRPALRDIIKKIPKKRGFGKNRAKTVNPSARKPVVVNLKEINALSKTGMEISPKSLVTLGLVKKSKGKLPWVKILGTGDISKKLTVVGCSVSNSAREKIEKAGGEIK